jgi:NADH:ubiquinone oxidoreductase subunit E
MKTIEVCVGSSCHLKGAYDVVDRITSLIAEKGLKNRVCVEGSFCLDLCQHGVAVRVGDRIFSARTEEDADRILAAALEES